MPYFPPDRSRNNKGVSLIELLLVIALVGFLVLLIGNLPNSISLIGKAKNSSIAREVVSKKVEDLRVTPYANLALGSSPLSDQRILLLPSGTGTTLIENCDPQICTSGEDMKQVTVTVTWKEGGKNQKVEVKTMLSEKGLGQ